MKALKYVVLLVAAMCAQRAMSVASVTDQLADGRILLFDDYNLTTDVPPTWVHEGTALMAPPVLVGGLLAGLNHYHRTGWSLLNTRMGQRNMPATLLYVPPQMTTNYLPPALNVNYSANLMNTNSAAIYSPVFTNGIGTLYFEAINVSLVGTGVAPELTVDIATNLVGGAALSAGMNMADENVEWQMGVFTTNLNVTSISAAVRVMEKIEVSQAMAFRIRRSSVDGTALESYYACVDNIRVSPGAPDIVFSNTNAVVEALGTYVECDISNRPGTLVPTDHTTRNVQLWYRWFSADEETAWASMDMVYEPGTGTDGDGERWKATGITFQPAMGLAYYFAYTGDTVYQSPDYTEQGHTYPVETGARSETFSQAGEIEMVTVTFDAVGGTVTPSSEEYIVGGRYNSPGKTLPTPVRTGYTFDNWYADSAYTGDAVTNTTIVLKSVETLYAKWEPVTYFVRYNPRGGSGDMADSVHAYDVAQDLTMNAFVQPGFSFAGWATNTPYTVVIYANGANVLNLSSVQDATNNLYAVWTANLYTVSFDPRGGTVAPTSRQVTFGSTYGVIPTPFRTGYTFSGWHTGIDGAGTLITSLSTVTTPNDHTLYAAWTANDYTVQFNAQGGAVSPDSMSVTYDAPYGEMPVPTRYGYLFGGWFTVAGGGGTQVFATTPVAITGTQTLFAKWVENTDWYTTNTLAVTYVIYTAEELMGLSRLVNAGTTDFDGKTVILGADIDMSVIPPWLPIGTNEAAVFMGTLDGQAKVVSGLEVAPGVYANAGLFGVLGANGVVKNVNVTLDGYTLNGSQNVGGLAGVNKGLIQNCQVLGGTLAGAGNIGGLAGWNQGVIQNAFGTVPVPNGLVGLNDTGARVENGYWWSEVSATGIGGGAGETIDVCAFSGYPGTLTEAVFDTQVMSDALNLWVRDQNASHYWWTDGTEEAEETEGSHPLLTRIAPPQGTMELNEARILLFDDYALTNNTPDPTWVHEGGAPTGLTVAGLLTGSNHYHRTGWVFLNTRMGQRYNAMYVPPQMAANYIPPTLTTNYSANLMNTTDAAMYSPIFTDGIGTVYFEAINVASVGSGVAPVLTVDIATNMMNGDILSGDMTSTDVDWRSVHTVTLNATAISDFVRVVKKIDIRQPVALRIKRETVNSTARDNYYACIDNIRVSMPAADIVFSTPPAPFDIGYPSVNTPGGRAMCYIDNMAGPYKTSYAGGTRTNVQVVTRWNYIPSVPNPVPGWVTPWQTSALNCIHAGDGVGDGERWDGVVPQYPDKGSIEYYFVAAFNGVHYQSPNYAYINSPDEYVYLPETPSPKAFGSAAEPFRFDIRLYPAAFGEVVAVTDQFGEIPMRQSGTNEWQALISVVGTTVSNITWYFKGRDEYLGNYDFSDDTVYWCNLTGIRYGSLPYGDNCLNTLDAEYATNEVNRFEVKVVPDESNFVLLTLNTEQTSFMAGRGEYQDFNAWNGSDHVFTHTFDKYPKTSYVQEFTEWPLPAFESVQNHWGEGPTLPANVAHLEQVQDSTFWTVLGSFEYVEERTPVNDLPDWLPFERGRNQAVRLFGGSPYLGLGYLQGNEEQVQGTRSINGVGTVSFKARLSRLPKNNDFYCFEPAVYTQGYTLSNYLMRVYLSVSALSPEAPSLSAIIYYQSPYAFYEYRVTQITDPNSFTSANSSSIDANIDNRVRHQFFKWSNGVANQLFVSEEQGRKLADIMSNQNPLEVRAWNEGTSVRFRGQVGGTSSIFNLLDSTPLCRSGTCGFISTECSVNLVGGTSGTYLRETDVGAEERGAGWRLTPLDTVNAPFWSLSPIYESSGGTFRTKALTGRVRVKLGNTAAGPWENRGDLTVSGFQYQNLSLPVEEWQRKYVRLQAVGAESGEVVSDVVLDGVVITSWRGNIEPFNGWQVINGWVTTNAPSADRIARLDATQSDPEQAQSVQSPRMMGVGSISFDYRVVKGPATLRIQYSTEIVANATELTGYWTDLGPESVISNDTATGWQTFSHYYGEHPETNLYLRILNDRSDASEKSIVEIDNIVIFNNPTNSPNDWIAYNARITGIDTNRWWIDTEKSAFLNNSPTMGVDFTQLEFDPYVMSPKLLRGLGRVSFLARAYDPATVNTENAVVTVQATTNEWSVRIPDWQWEDIHSFTLHTNAFYRPYSVTLTNGLNNYKAVRLAVKGGKTEPGGPDGRQRICLDEILVTEQIYAKFDIANVKLLLETGEETRQPMEGQDIGVEAQLTNMLLEPTNITLRLAYVIGTDTWGVFDGARSCPMYLVDEENRIYRTAEPFMLHGIPEQNRNTIVQYMVIAEYEEAGKSGRYEIQQEMPSFTNPEWYDPVDLNKQFGATSDRWSPYYIVYDVSPGSVWINEINIRENMGVGDQYNPYIEIVVPGWMDLNGWSIDFLSGLPSMPTTNNLRIESTAVSKNLDDDTGYAYYVIGPSVMSKTDYVVENLNSFYMSSIFISPYAARLKRPSGIHEQTVVFDYMPEYQSPDGKTWASQFTDGVAHYVGYDQPDGSLSFIGTVTEHLGQFIREDSTNTWESGKSNFNWTPGEPNMRGQPLPPVPQPGGSNVLITSVMSSMNGTQNGQRIGTLLIKIRKNTSTNIVYEADNWYRLYSVRSNGVESLPLSPANSFTLNFNNIQSSAEVLVRLDLREDVQGDFPPDFDDWLKEFPEGDLAPTYLNTLYTGKQLSLQERFWINANPTTTNLFTFKMPATHEFVYEDSRRILYLALEMALNGERIDRLQGGSVVKAMHTRDLISADWVLTSQFILSGSTFDAANKSRVRLHNFLPEPPTFFKWSLQLEDPLSSTYEMVNEPKP
ncbi:MAG: InlB B-repeat-containing protein [Kiritimatiellaeota bacterium]|nr:InlB B-repeat-containing protein [Kiritimatiellota bacterium]